jgi:hypothetical protein
MPSKRSSNPLLLKLETVGAPFRRVLDNIRESNDVVVPDIPTDIGALLIDSIERDQAGLREFLRRY